MIGVLVPADAYTAYVVSTGAEVDGCGGRLVPGRYWYLLSGGVFLVQSIVPTGSGDLAVAGSTLAAAAAFGPIRKQLQLLVERRFNRSRYLAEQVVGDFGVRLRNSFDVAQVATDLQSVVSRTLAPTSAELWLRSR